MWKVAWAGLALMLMTQAQASPVHKCEIDGRTIYQGIRCPPGTAAEPGQGGTMSALGGGFDIHLHRQLQQRIASERQAAARANAAASRREQQQARAEEIERSARAARSAGLIPAGSSTSTAISLWGRPDRTSRSQMAGQNCEHMRWSNPYRTVFACDGEVVRSYRADD